MKSNDCGSINSVGYVISYIGVWFSTPRRYDKPSQLRWQKSYNRTLHLTNRTLDLWYGCILCNQSGRIAHICGWVLLMTSPTALQNLCPVRQRRGISQHGQSIQFCWQPIFGALPLLFGPFSTSQAFQWLPPVDKAFSSTLQVLLRFDLIETMLLVFVNLAKQSNMLNMWNMSNVLNIVNMLKMLKKAPYTKYEKYTHHLHHDNNEIILVTMYNICTIRTMCAICTIYSMCKNKS